MGVLRAKVNGQWVDIGVSPNVPTYANKAALDTWIAPNGSQAYTADFGLLWLRRGGVWIVPYAIGRIASGPTFDVVTTGGTQLNAGTITGLQMFAGRRYCARIALVGGMYGSVAGDSWNAGHRIDGGAMTAGATFAIQLANAYTQGPTFFTPFTTTDGTHTLDACVARAAGTGTLQFRGRLDILDEGPV